MAFWQRLRDWLSPLVYLSNNVISLSGVVLTTLGGVSWLFLLPVYIGERHHHPYVGILFYMAIPAVFITGLLLIPLGIWIRRRRTLRRGESMDFPPLNWESRAFRRILYFVLGATTLNVLIAGHFTYEGVRYMDSTSFCGLTCHSVMEPEYTAYQESSHFRVGCTECHIGEGAPWFVKSKLSGAGQVVAVLFDTYDRPIPTPIHDLRPARETCENCHWPQMFAGNRIVVKNHFADDEPNTHTKTVLMMHIGGGSVDRGIHGFHLDPGVEIRYRSDATRTSIPWVSYTDREGTTTVYATEDWDPAQAGELELRVMDCLDCHNRPSHTFEMPGPALDEALADGRISPSLPWIKREGMQILQTEFATAEQARRQIPIRVQEFYQRDHPDLVRTQAAEIRQASETLLAIWQRNIFPQMGITWGAYPNHIGHEVFPGCFRCHDGEHASENGEASISQDCTSCHEMLAWDEEEPEILDQLGLNR